jgi:hypothetical protein
LNYPEFQLLVCFIKTKTEDIHEINLAGCEYEMKNREKVSRVRSGGITLGYKLELTD